jgi:hypothetical protein
MRAKARSEHLERVPEMAACFLTEPLRYVNQWTKLLCFLSQGVHASSFHNAVECWTLGVAHLAWPKNSYSLVQERLLGRNCGSVSITNFPPSHPCDTRIAYSVDRRCIGARGAFLDGKFVLSSSKKIPTRTPKLAS